MTNSQCELAEILGKMKVADDVANRMVKGLSADPKRDCYVYALCNEKGIPFYIGQGRDTRLLDHEKECEHEIQNGVSYNDLSDKHKAICKAGLGLRRVIIKWGLSKQEALMCESALINFVEYVAAASGKVISLTNKSDGHSSEPEKMSRAGDKTVARTLDDFVRECGAEEREIRDLDKYGIACIKINKLYLGCLQASTEDTRAERIRECVRGCWCIGKKARGKIEYLFALYQQQVVGIYRVVRCVVCNPLSLKGERVAFPNYPEDVRRIDLNEGLFKNLKDARKVLSSADYRALDGRLKDDYRYQKHKRNKDAIMAEFQKRRVFFVVDEEIPKEIQEYMHCILTQNGKRDFLTKGYAQRNPVWLNFR